MNRPYRYAATIHPVRYFSKEFLPSNNKSFIPASQEYGFLSNGAGLKRRRWTFYETINLHSCRKPRLLINVPTSSFIITKCLAKSCGPR